MTKTTHTPKGEELSEAIGMVLKKHVGPVDVQIVKDQITNNHPEWKIPDRRLNKFLKRHLNKHQSPAKADDDDTIGTEQAPGGKKKGGRGIFKIFSRRSEQKNLDIPSPVKEAPSTPATLLPEEPESPKEEEVVVPEPEPVPEPVMEPKNLESLYDDDNDVSNREKCECNACAIM